MDSQGRVPVSFHPPDEEDESTTKLDPRAEPRHSLSNMDSRGRVPVSFHPRDEEDEGPTGLNPRADPFFAPHMDPQGNSSAVHKCDERCQDESKTPLSPVTISPSIYTTGGDPEVRKQRFRDVIGADRQDILEQIVSKSSILVLTKSQSMAWCKARFCLQTEKTGFGSMPGFSYCLNLKDQTGKRKNDFGDAQPDRYYHVPCFEQMFELGVLFMEGLAKCDKAKKLDLPKLEDWIKKVKDWVHKKGWKGDIPTLTEVLGEIEDQKRFAMAELVRPFLWYDDALLTALHQRRYLAEAESDRATYMEEAGKDATDAIQVTMRLIHEAYGIHLRHLTSSEGGNKE